MMSVYFYSGSHSDNTVDLNRDYASPSFQSNVLKDNKGLVTPSGLLLIGESNQDRLIVSQVSTSDEEMCMSPWQITFSMIALQLSLDLMESCTSLIGRVVPTTLPSISIPKCIRQFFAFKNNSKDNLEDINDLKNYNSIPAPLHHDPIFKSLICPITQVPIRYVVGDPNGTTLYEKRSIEEWVVKNHTSPVTREPLELSQLISKPTIQSLIDHRLDHFSNILRNKKLKSEGWL